MSGFKAKQKQQPKRKARAKVSAPAMIRTAQDYVHKLPMVLHDDGLRAHKEIKDRFRGRGRAQREAVNIALMLYAKIARELNLGPGDQIEEILEL